MGITHSWDGTVLTITSDSGTSSADLKGSKGGDGARGPQGVAGSVFVDDINLSAECKELARNNINAYRAINEQGENITFAANGALPLSVVSTFEPKQEGEGEASLTNIRDIKAYTAATVKHTVGENTKEYTNTFPFAIGGGFIDWETGKLTLTHDLIIITGKETVGSYEGGIYFNAIMKEQKNRAAGLSNVAKVGTALNESGVFVLGKSSASYPNGTKSVYWNDGLNTVGVSTNDELKQWLAAQYEAGTPVKILYELSTPLEYYLMPYEIEALAGENNIYTMEGNTTISNLKGNSAALRNILERLAALENAMGG